MRHVRKTLITFFTLIWLDGQMESPVIVEVVKFIETFRAHVTLVFPFIKVIPLHMILKDGLDLVLFLTKVTRILSLPRC